MDINHLQRRFLALLQRASEELAGIRRANEQQAQSIREQQQAGEERWTPEPDVRAILNTLQGIERKQNIQEQNQNDYQRRNFYVQLAGVLTLLLYTTFTFWQAYTLTKQTQILSAQSVDSAAQAITEERSTAKQLELLGNQVEASKDAAVAAKRAADTAAGELELSERPWISVESVRIPDDQSLIVGNKVIMTTVAVAIRNIGRSPATNVSVRVQLTMGGTGSFEDTVRGVCENAVGDTRTPFGQTIFQDKAGTPIEYPVTLPPNEVAAYWKQRAGSFSVFGCAGYRSSFSRKFYYTGFIYTMLLKKYPDSPIKIPGRDTFLQSALAGFITK